MRARYNTATVYVNHYLRLSFLYKQRDQTITELMKSKVAFENFAQFHRVQVRNYTTENVRFTEMNSSRISGTKNQGISYCGVNSHHQNRNSENELGTYKTMQEY